MQRVAQRISRYLPLLLWIGFISFASTSEFSGANTSRIIRPLLLWLFPGISDERVYAVHFAVRKLAHFTEYAVLGFLAARAFATSQKDFLKRHWFILALFLIASYSLLDEYHQSYIPSRRASVYDSMIDAAGGLAALLLYRRQRKRA